MGIYKLLTYVVHECGNRERGHAVSFLGIHKSDLLCCAHVTEGLKETLAHGPFFGFNSSIHPSPAKKGKQLPDSQTEERVIER